MYSTTEKHGGQSESAGKLIAMKVLCISTGFDKGKSSNMLLDMQKPNI